MNAAIKPVKSNELFMRAGLPQRITYSTALRTRYRLTNDDTCPASMELAWLVRSVLTDQIPSRKIRTAIGLTRVVAYASLADAQADRSIAVTETGPHTVQVALPEEVVHSLPRILVVDDNVDLAELTGQFLTAAGFSCSLAHDGLAGWEQVLQSQPGIVLLDVDMPHLNGLGLLDKIRKHPELAGMPVLMWSGDPGHEVRARKDGASDFIGKPCQFSDLIFRLKHLLGHH